MADWIPPANATAREIATELASNMAGVYGAIEEALVADIARLARLYGLADGMVPFDQKLAALREFRRAAENTILALNAGVDDEAQRVVQIAATQGAAAAVGHLNTSLGGLDWPTINMLHVAIPGALPAAVIAADLTSKLTQLHSRILRFAEDAYQAAVAYAAPLAVTGVLTGTQATRVAWDRLMAQGISGFADSAGRRWNLATYAEMATRTAIIRAWQDANVQKASDAGVRLFRVIIGKDSCDRCARYAGKILAATGPAGQRTEVVEHATIDGEYRNVTIANTIAGARDDGWNHPNCRCTLVAWFPGISLPATTTASTYDPQDERDREQLRALERQVRAWKRRLAGALDERSAANSRAAIRAVQARIRQHVSRTGLIRQRRREALDLGFRPFEH